MSSKKGVKLETLISLYENKVPIVQISEKVGTSISNVSKRLKKAGYDIIRDYSKDRRVRTNRKKVDLEFFNKIDTKEKAYFLGIMYADGSVSKNQFYLKLNDKEVLDAFKKYLNCDNEVKKVKNSKAYILTISSKKICNDLIKHGCTPNKTKTIRFPKIDKELQSHFIRGFLDGDGCILMGNTVGTSGLNFTSASLLFLKDLEKVLLPYIKHSHISKEKTDVWHLRCHGKQILTILNYIYSDANIYMYRKYEKYNKLIGSSKTG